MTVDGGVSARFPHDAELTEIYGQRRLLITPVRC